MHLALALAALLIAAPAPDPAAQGHAVVHRVQRYYRAAKDFAARFDQLYTYVMFGMVLSYTLTVIGLFVLRWKRPEAARPYRCFGYPWLPGFYVLVIGAWTLNTIFTRPTEALAGTGIVLLGVPGYLYWKRSSKKTAAAE